MDESAHRTAATAHGTRSTAPQARGPLAGERAGSPSPRFSTPAGTSLERRRQAGLNGIAKARAALAEAARRAEDRSAAKAA